MDNKQQYYKKKVDSERLMTLASLGVLYFVLFSIIDCENVTNCCKSQIVTNHELSQITNCHKSQLLRWWLSTGILPARLL